MDAGPRFSILELLTIVNSVCETYLKSPQYAVRIEEEDERGDADCATIDMSTFLTKAVARRLTQVGVEKKQIIKALERMDAPEITYPSAEERGLTVLGSITVRFSDGHSPVRAER